MQSTRALSVALEVPTDDQLEQPLGASERVEYNLENVLECLDLAARWDPDFVVFPEQMLHRRTGRDERIEVAQPVPGSATEAVGEKARELDSYVWLPLTERDGDDRYNALALIDPDGEVRGSYRKVRPTAGEIDDGLQPGTEVPGWDTPFGRVGGAICYDLMYPEVGIELARREADLLFFSSHLQGRKRIQHWARDYGFHVVKSHPKVAEVAVQTDGIVARNQRNWSGQEPLEDLAAGGHARFGYAELNTDMRTYTRGPGNRRAIEEITAAYPDVVYHDSGFDETFVLESRSETVTVDELEDEYDLVTYRDAVDRTGRACLEADPDSRLGAESFPEPEG